MYQLSSMKLLIAIGLTTVCCLVSSEVLTVDNCKCGDGFKPEKSDDGQVQCVGINVYSIMPCNIPQPPKCKCSGDVSGILIDEDGTWCNFFEKGKSTQKWPCENKEEWAEFEKLRLT